MPNKQPQDPDKTPDDSKVGVQPAETGVDRSGVTPYETPKAAEPTIEPSTYSIKAGTLNVESDPSCKYYLTIRGSNDEDVIINPGEIKSIPTGVSFKLLECVVARVEPYPVLANQHGLILLNSNYSITSSDNRKDLDLFFYNSSKICLRVGPKTKLARICFIMPDYIAMIPEKVDGTPPV